jgi:hypothetical protein
MGRSYIIPLDPSNSTHLKILARLHEDLLPDSLIAKLGRFFMERFYYSKLVGCGLIQCNLFIHDDRVVGFCGFTRYPYTFMSEGRRKYGLLLAWVLLVSVLVRPSRFFDIHEAARQGRTRKPHPDNVYDGEFLSLAVLPYHAHAKDDVSGLRVSDALYQRTLDFMKSCNLSHIRSMVKVSNRLAIRFHERQGSIYKDNDGSVPKGSCLLVKVLTP